METPRILLIRTSALGDIVHTLPVLSALRCNLPRARIAWIVEKGFLPLLEGHPDLDQTLAVDLRGWRKRPFSPSTWRELGGFLSALHAFGAEIALDLMGNHKAGALALLSLCDQRIGLDRAWRREPSSALWLSRTVPGRGPHAVDLALSVLDALDVPPGAAAFDGDKLFSAVLAPGSGDGRGVLIHPGTGWANKNYPADRWGEVARTIGEATGLRSRVSSGPGEEELAGELIAESGGWAEPLAGSTLTELAAAIRRSALVLGGDTGPVHLAHAMGVPVLCVMGPTDPERNGPYGDPGSVVVHPLPCSYCYRRFDSVKPCLLEIPAEEVAERALELLGSVDEPDAGSPKPV